MAPALFFCQSSDLRIPRIAATFTKCAGGWFPLDAGTMRVQLPR